MPKSRVFKDTADVLQAAFPVLLKGLKEVSDAIPAPAGSVVKGVVQTTIFIMNKAEEYRTSQENIYLLSARSAQVVATIVNECQGRNPDEVDRKLGTLNAILEEISSWVQSQVPTGRAGKILLRLKSDDNIKQVLLLNRRLDEAIALFGLENQITIQKTSSDIQAIVESTTGLMMENKRRLESMEMRQFITQRLPPRVETLTPSDHRCLSGTRQNILDDIKGWLLDSQPASSGTHPMIYWMTGVAGSGKSTIARSVIELAKERKSVCSWFCFSRDPLDQRTSNNLMTTVAHDLTSSGDITLVQKIHDAIDKDKIDGSSPLSRQMEGFLHCPVRAANIPVTLVWDALDECTDAASRGALLNLLSALTRLPPSTRIFLTSRAESDLEDMRGRLGGMVRHHDLTFNPRNEHDCTLRDIDAYIRDRFEKMPGDRKDWLDSETLERLKNIVDGLFMIAQFVCDLINHRQGHRRLESLLKEPKYGEGGSATKRLYFWYRTGLNHLFREDASSEIQEAKTVMAAILVARYPLSGKAYATLLGLSEETTNSALHCLSPFLVLEATKMRGVEGSPRAVRFVHKSISDFFLSDEAGEFRIDTSLACAQLAVPCLKILRDQIYKAFKICRSHSPTSLSEDPEPRDSHAPQLSEALAYACQFWGFHLKDLTVLDETVEGLLDDLFLSHLLEWLHLMGRLDAFNAAISCLRWTGDWKPATFRSDLTELAKDGIRFIQVFSYPLRTYTNMDFPSLHFTPTDTLLYQTYSTTVSSQTPILSGIPNNWSSLMSNLAGHTGLVRSVAFSPDGKQIVSGSDDKTLCVWDASTGQPLGPPLEGHTDWVMSVAISPDGKHIVSGSKDKTVRIWSASTRESLGLLMEGHTDWVRSVAFSPDGKHVVSASHDKTLRIWDALTGKQSGPSMEGHTDRVTSVAFSPDGMQIISGSDDKTVRFWNVLTRKPFGRVMQGHTSCVTSVAFFPDGKRIVSGSYDNTLRIWDAFTQEPFGPPMEGHTSWVMSIALSSDGKQVVSGSSDSTLRIWNASTWKPVGPPMEGHTSSIMSVAFSPDGRQIVSGANDKTLRIWDASIGQSIEEPTNSILCVAFSPNGQQIVSGSDDKTLRLWDALTGEPFGSPMEGHTSWVGSVSFSPDGKKVVSGSYDRTLRVWDALTGKPFGSPMEGHTSWIMCVAFSPDGKYIVSGAGDYTLRVWDTSTGKPLGLPMKGHTGSVMSVAFSPDGKHIVSGSNDMTVRVWDASSGQLCGLPMKGHTRSVTSVSTSPDGNQIISRSDYQSLRIWDTWSGKLLGSGTTEQKAPSDTDACTLLADGWLKTHDDKLICWLPPHHRGRAKAWSQTSRCFAVGSRTGILTIIKVG